MSAATSHRADETTQLPSRGAKSRLTATSLSAIVVVRSEPATGFDRVASVSVWYVAWCGRIVLLSLSTQATSIALAGTLVRFPRINNW